MRESLSVGRTERAHLCGELTPLRALQAQNLKCCSPKTYISFCPEAGAAHAHRSGPFSQVEILSLKISRSTSSLAGVSDTNGQVSVSTLCVSPGLCAVSVLAAVFVGGIGGRTCLILFPQKQVWEEKKVCLFYSPRLRSVAGDSVEYLFANKLRCWSTSVLSVFFYFLILF